MELLDLFSIFADSSQKIHSETS